MATTFEKVLQKQTATNEKVSKAVDKNSKVQQQNTTLLVQGLKDILTKYTDVSVARDKDEYIPKISDQIRKLSSLEGWIDPSKMSGMIGTALSRRIAETRFVKEQREKGSEFSTRELRQAYRARKGNIAPPTKDSENRDNQSTFDNEFSGSNVVKIDPESISDIVDRLKRYQKDSTKQTAPAGEHTREKKTATPSEEDQREALEIVHKQEARLAHIEANTSIIGNLFAFLQDSHKETIALLGGLGASGASGARGGILSKLISGLAGLAFGMGTFRGGMAKAAGKAAGSFGFKAAILLIKKSIAKFSKHIAGSFSGIGKFISRNARKALSVVGKSLGNMSGSISKIARTLIEKLLSKFGLKTLGKSLLKKIPGVSLIAGTAFAAKELWEGDIEGAALEMASGAAGTIPLAGTALSAGIDIYNASREDGAAVPSGAEDDVAIPPRKKRRRGAEVAVGPAVPSGADVIYNQSTQLPMIPQAKSSAPTVVNAPSSTVQNNNNVFPASSSARNSDSVLRRLQAEQYRF